MALIQFATLSSFVVTLVLYLHWVPLITSSNIHRIQLVVNGTCYNQTFVTLVSMIGISIQENNLLVVGGCSL